MEEELEEQEEDIWIKIFSSASSFKQYRDFNYFNCQPIFNSVFSTNNLSRTKDTANMINLDDNKVIPQEVLNKTKDKAIERQICQVSSLD